MVAGGVSHGDEEAREVYLAGGPRWTLGGHVHRALGFFDTLNQTVSLNPGQGNHPERPNHIVIDMEERVATRYQPTAAGITRHVFNFAP